MQWRRAVLSRVTGTRDSNREKKFVSFSRRDARYQLDSPPRSCSWHYCKSTPDWEKCTKYHHACGLEMGRAGGASTPPREYIGVEGASQDYLSKYTVTTRNLQRKEEEVGRTPYTISPQLLK